MFVPDDHQIGRLGVNAVERTVVGELGWIFREVQHTDVGIDAHIEVREAEQATGLILACQIKCGPSWFREVGDQGWVFRPKNAAHVAYWMDYALPVLILLVDLDGKSYWQYVSKKTAIRTGKGWKLEVPQNQLLGNTSRLALGLHAAAGSIRMGLSAENFARIGPLLYDDVRPSPSSGIPVSEARLAPSFRHLFTCGAAPRLANVGDPGSPRPERSSEVIRQSVGKLLDSMREAVGQPGYPDAVGTSRHSSFLESLIDAGFGHLEILLGFQLPNTSKRVDVVLCGVHPRTRKPSYALIQLNAALRATAQPSGLVTLGDRQPMLNPAEQASRYADYLRRSLLHEMSNSLEIWSGAYFSKAQFIDISSIVNLDYSSGLTPYSVNGLQSLLRDLRDQFDCSVDSRDSASLAADELLERKFRPVPPLTAFVGSLVQDHTLLDEQQIAIVTVLDAVRRNEECGRESAVIVSGGTGSGKSLVALYLMEVLRQQGKQVRHATGSSSFTNTMRRISGEGRRIGHSQFTYFNSFIGAPPSVIDVLICDEAHRIRETSVNRFTRRALLEEARPQIEELVRVAKVAVFLIDEKQTVRPGELGSVELITDAARRQGRSVEVVHLDGQFRCGGSEFYESWIDSILSSGHGSIVPWPTLAAHTNDTFEVSSAKSVEELESWILGKSQLFGGSWRITAGYCWKWSDPVKHDGVRTLPADIQIGDWSKPWVAKPEKPVPGVPASHFWAVDPRGSGQVGLIYTAQGFEYDWAGVIVGGDYIRRDGKWVASREASMDGQAKRANDADFQRYIRNTYRVLLTRGVRGVCIFSVDRETQQFLDAVTSSGEGL